MDSAKQISKESNSSFYYAFNLLPEKQRDAMNTVYAFFRKTDDIVDDLSTPSDIKYEKLRKWRLEFEKAFAGRSEYPLLNKLGKIISNFNIPLDPFFELIKGMEMDLQKDRYKNFDDLLVYCYRVASTVGLICIEIFGYKNPSTKDFAVNLGIALQLTNILRDLGKDAEQGRIYIPQEDFLRFNYSEAQLYQKISNENFKQLMKYEVERAKNYFYKATQALDLDDKKTMFAARAMQYIYYRMLDKIIKSDYDVLNNEIKLKKIEKVGIAFGVWAKYQLVY